MKATPLALLALLSGSIYTSAIEPTPNRQWKSTEGKTITAKATDFDGDSVTLVLTNGKTYKTPLSNLDVAEREYIRTHFLTQDVAPSEAAKPSQNILKQESSEGSFYYHYVPSSAPKDRKMPAMFWTSGGAKGTPRSVNFFIKGAEITGMTIITCGNSSNSSKGNSAHIDRNLMHSIEHLNLEEERIFFGGISGGAARSLGNASKYKFAGGMPVVGYMPSSAKPPKSDYYYVIGGAYDYNRYGSAVVADYFGKTGIHRIVPGGHGCNDLESFNDGIIWLYTMNSYLKRTAKTDEKVGFENRLYSYLTGELTNQPWRAYYWTNHMLNVCKMSGVNKSKFQELHKTLKSDKKNELYLEGREELEKFSGKNFKPVGSGSRHKHTTKSITRDAAKFKEKYGSIPRFNIIARDLARKTD